MYVCMYVYIYILSACLFSHLHDTFNLWNRTDRGMAGGQASRQTDILPIPGIGSSSSVPHTRGTYIIYA